VTDTLPVPLLATADVEAHQHFVDLVAQVRPELFKYCARMTGSIFDGEDIVQETLAKAYLALGSMTQAPPLCPLEVRRYRRALDYVPRPPANRPDSRRVLQHQPDLRAHVA